MGHLYRAALNGYAARIPAGRVAQLRADPRVAYVEADAAVTTTAQTLPWGINRIDADVSSALAGNGSGAVGTTNAYVIDTGISAHADLNLVAHGNWTGDGKNYDCNGHGTHVAGTVGAKDNASHVVGAGPGVALIGLKVLGCDGGGFMSNVIAAVDWLTVYAKKPAVANMSLSGGALKSLDDAVRKSASTGVLYVVAAGNSGADACNHSPARAGAGTNNGIVTVAATDSSNKEPSWSNYGSCVDIWGPRGEHPVHVQQRWHRHRVGHLHGLPPRVRHRRALPVEEHHGLTRHRGGDVEGQRAVAGHSEQGRPGHQGRLRRQVLTSKRRGPRPLALSEHGTSRAQLEGPRTGPASTPTPGLVFAILALVGLVAFWAGISGPLAGAAAAVATGGSGKTHQRSGAETAAIATGVAVVLMLIASIFG